MFNTYGPYIFPVVFLAGGVSGAYFLGRDNQIQREAKGFSSDKVVEYVLREVEKDTPICETWKTKYENDRNRLSTEKCREIVRKIWGSKENQPREWLRVNKDVLNDVLWQNYLTKNDSRDDQLEKKWKAKRNLICEQTKVESLGKVIVSCS